jgi:uroporphyrinogen-III synthase
MPTSNRPTVVLLSAHGTLDRIDPLLQRRGVRLVRITSIEPRPVDPRRWLPRARRRPSPDTVVVTSRAAVATGVRPWRERDGPPSASVEFWAVGPGTATALRRAGVRGVHRPGTAEAIAIARALGRTPRRKILYFRSDLAGPRLARALRRRGHRVVDLVVYRLRTRSRISARSRRDLTRAHLIVATSPSGLGSLRRSVGAPTFARLARNSRLVVLGPRSARAARRLGFQHTSVAPSTTAQRLTRHLLRELRDAGA